LPDFKIAELEAGRRSGQDPIRSSIRGANGGRLAGESSPGGGESPSGHRRQAAGSRFNLRWKDEIPAEYQTPEGIMQALAAYVDFSPMTGVGASAGGGTGVAALKKGMSIPEVEQALGPASGIQNETTGSLELSVRTYDLPEHQVVAKFASGVLVDFTISPR
jgi:hypothetical protein